MNANSKIEITFKNSKDLDSAIFAIEHEGKVETDRSIVKISRNGSSLIIEVTAKDVVALRASLNAHLRALQTIEGINTFSSQEE